jgi:hypothetical protein
MSLLGSVGSLAVVGGELSTIGGSVDPDVVELGNLGQFMSPGEGEGTVLRGAIVVLLVGVVEIIVNLNECVVVKRDGGPFVLFCDM